MTHRDLRDHNNYVPMSHVNKYAYSFASLHVVHIQNKQNYAP
jgi:hypothetical protein